MRKSSDTARRRCVDTVRRSADTLRRSVDTMRKSTDTLRKSADTVRKSPDVVGRTCDAGRKSPDPIHKSLETMRGLPRTPRKVSLSPASRARDQISPDPGVACFALTPGYYLSRLRREIDRGRREIESTTA
jgi:hypothetical protein